MTQNPYGNLILSKGQANKRFLSRTANEDVMLIAIFFGRRGIAHCELMLSGSTVTKEYYQKDLTAGDWD